MCYNVLTGSLYDLNAEVNPKYGICRLAVFDNQIRKMNTRIMEVFVGEKAAAKYDLENITVSRYILIVPSIT